MRKHLQLLLVLLVCSGMPAFAQQVTSFTLINADTDVPIKTLVNGDILNYSTLFTRNLNIVANTNPATVGSVVFLLDGIMKVENGAPYAYAGDNTSGTGINYKAISPALVAGAHTVTATAYSLANGTGVAGTALTVSFSVVENSSNTPPTANAGPDKSLTLPANSTTLIGSGSDAGGSIASYLWTKQNGSAATLTNANTQNLSVSNMVAGSYVFRLTVTDNQGATGYDEATVTVVASGGGNLAVTYFTLVNADNEQDIRTFVNGDILDYSTLPTRNLNIRANTNPATVGSIVFFLDGVRKNENLPPYSYAGEGTSGGVINYNKINPALAAGAHLLTATAYSSANGGGTVGTTHTADFTVVDNNTSNSPPTANAGHDKTLTLPANSTTLNGSGTDAGGSISSYLWIKQSGPAATLANANTQNLSVSNMVAGNYIFRLTVTDNQGATGYDEAVVLVNPAGTGGGGICATFVEQNGLVVIEIESQPTTSDWTQQTAVSGYTGSGYYEWRHGNTNTAAIAAGTGIITYTIQINNPGRYRLQIRSAAPQRTDYNDVWIKFPEGNGFGIEGSSVLTLAANWFKVYHNVSNNAWTWESKTKDHDPHDIYVDFPSAGIYRVQFSGRSNQFKIDRFVLYNSSVTSSTANNTGNAQSTCAGSNKTDSWTAAESATPITVYPNPSAGGVTVEFMLEQTGKTSLRIFDARGVLITTLFEGNAEVGEMKRIAFDGSKLPKGIYIARLIARDKVVTRRIVFQ